ncbi:TPA: triose-phosphate isomerase [Candidatus Falkowbacteria bacterium]|nr:triose-phosphate isomerase [Candidatus Falkowbacteria bacterium]
MKRYFVANWKMNLTHSDSIQLARQIAKLKSSRYQLIVAPSEPYLVGVAKALGRSSVKLSAQDLAAWPAGSFTGETSAAMVKEAGCRYAIIGHSERRQHLGESTELIGRKLQQAIDHGVTPIFCLGETEAERRAGQTKSVLMQQLKQSLGKIKNLAGKKLLIAYEPVWAIGSGRAVGLDDLEQAYMAVRHAVSMLVSAEYFDSKVSFLYGGSLSGDNLAAFLPLPFLGGFLVGGASLKIEEIKRMLDA